MSNLVNVVNYVLNLAGIAATDEDGQGLVEYVLIIALIAIAVVGGFAAVSGGVTDAFTGIETELGTSMGGDVTP